MIDYHADVLALEEFRNALGLTTFTDPHRIAARKQATQDLLVAGDSAVLGSLVTHLLAHASSDGSEIALLGRAADLWGRGVQLYNQLGQVRVDLENALENPSDPASAPRFSNAAFSIQLFAQQLQGLQADVTSLRDDTLTMAHLPSHPRQHNESADKWDWSNRLLGRRTDAFVRSLSRLATTSSTRAFALGALASYGANVAGSAYLGQLVGGPRRAHRFRERLAQNSIGSWLARAYPSTPSPGKLAAQVRFGGLTKARLPTAIEQLLEDALTATFDLSRTTSRPDLPKGYRRLLRHLRLLDGFSLPAPPAPPSGIWPARLYGDPSNPPPSLRPQDVGLSGDPGGGVSLGNNTTGSSTPSGDDGSKGSTICGIIALILIIIDVIQAFVQCIVQWANKQKCTFWDNMLLKKLWEKDPPDPRDPTTPEPIDTSSSELTAMSSTDEVVQLIGCLFDIHGQVWEALDRARNFLAFHGLIYPADLVDRVVYKQFTAIPAPDTSWPRRPVADPLGMYHLYPTSAIEHPTVASSLFAVGITPNAFLPLGANRISLPLWEQMARDEQDSQNFDMDADRGFLHPCWATGKSINDDPILVHVLGYNEQ